MPLASRLRRHQSSSSTRQIFSNKDSGNEANKDSDIEVTGINESPTENGLPQRDLPAPQTNSEPTKSTTPSQVHDSESAEPTTKKRKTTSKVWHHFDTT